MVLRLKSHNKSVCFNSGFNGNEHFSFLANLILMCAGKVVHFRLAEWFPQTGSLGSMLPWLTLSHLVVFKWKGLMRWGSLSMRHQEPNNKVVYIFITHTDNILCFLLGVTAILQYPELVSGSLVNIITIHYYQAKQICAHHNENGLAQSNHT